jgi:GxxExxY protein
MLIEEKLTEAIIAAAIEVHREMGPGLLESGYRACLCRELSVRGIPFQCEVKLPLTYKGVQLDVGYRIDILVNDAVIVEIKAIEKLLPVHHAQLLTYMKLSGKRVGLLINFNVELLKYGLVRRVI